MSAQPWRVVLSDAEISVFRRTGDLVLLRPRFDVQVGDTVKIFREARDYVVHEAEVIHVMQNVTGIERGWLVITLNDNRADRLKAQYERAHERALRLERSNIALRGQITKLRKRIQGVA